MTPSVLPAPALASRGRSQPARAPRPAILCVDDDAALSRLLCRRIQALGYAATAVTSPLQALAVLRAEPARYDVLVTDYSMAGMNGLELARAAVTESPQLAVVLVTGHADVPGQESFAQPAVARVIAKPFDPRELAHTLAALLRERDETRVSG